MTYLEYGFIKGILSEIASQDTKREPNWVTTAREQGLDLTKIKPGLYTISKLEPAWVRRARQGGLRLTRERDGLYLVSKDKSPRKRTP